MMTPIEKRMVATVLAQRRVTLVGRRTNAYKKLAKRYATRELDPGAFLGRNYNATGNPEGNVTPVVEAKLAAEFLYSAYGVLAKADGGRVVVSYGPDGADIQELDELIGSIAVVQVGDVKSDPDFAAAMYEWQANHPGVYVDADGVGASYVVGPRNLITNLPAFK